MRNKKSLIILAVLLLTVLVAEVTIWQVKNHKGKKSGEEAGTEVNINPPIPVTMSEEMVAKENAEILDAYKAMKEDNPDFAGYLRIPGTRIEYPVMYTPADPEKYLHSDLYGAYSDYGLPFIDTRCDLDPESDNIIIYGHNMKDGSMFATIIDYQDKSYFDEHPVIRYDTPDEIREYEVMSVFYDRVYYEDEDVFKFYNFYHAYNEDEFNEAVDQYLKKSLYDTGIRAEYGDKLITLVTCAYHTENGRFVVIARRKQAE